jgi:hypothetical protein
VRNLKKEVSKYNSDYRGVGRMKVGIGIGVRWR